MSAGFVEVNDDLESFLDVENEFDQVIDTCEIDDVDDGGDFLDFDETPFSLSAGETITVTSAAGTYATLLMNSAAGLIVYIPEEELVSPLPQNLIVDIPGDQFPAFSNVSIPNVNALDVSPTPQETITGNTNFQWTGTTQTFSFLTIEASFDTNTGFVDVVCIARDDGSFSFPANISSQVGGSEASFVDISRTGFDVVFNGDSQLLVFNIFEQIEQ